MEEDKLSNEGEATRYFEHALALKWMIKFLRNNADLTVYSGGGSNEAADEPMGLDLLRCESLASLDEESRQRLLAKNYSVLFSMAPFNSSGEAISSPPPTADSPFHLGPVIPEVNSPWFRFYLYDLIGSGPPSLLIPKGSGFYWTRRHLHKLYCMLIKKVNG